MANISAFLNSSLGKKVVMATTGLFLCVFLVEHLYTNLLLFYGDGGAEFNEASHTMVHSILIRTVEIILFVAIIIHASQALYLTRSNSTARPVKYAMLKVEETSSWFSRNMGLTGSIILFFIVIHLYHFFVPYRVTGTVGGEGHTSIAQLVIESLGNPLYALLYLVSVMFLAFHLNHGFQSAFQTLGVNNKKYAPVLKIVGTGFALVMGIGFALFPIICFLAKMNNWDLLNWNK